MVSIHIRNFNAPNLNDLYCREPDERFREWRKIGAGEKVRNLVSMVGKSNGQIANVLEVGCGTGAVLEGLAAANIGSNHFGIDVGYPLRNPTANRGRFVFYDGRHIPFPDHSFDLVYATHVLEHVLDERGFLGELARVSRQLVYVEVPCEVHWRTTFDSLQKTLKIGHINAYTPETFGLILETSGLQVARLELFDHDFALYRFESSFLKAALKSTLRKSILGISPMVAARIFTYHCGALCKAGQPMQLRNARAT